MKELVTVILPTFNGQDYIQQMLDSIYAQEYRPIEVIITDDASTDGTVSIINNWVLSNQEPDLSCRMIMNDKNKGISRNLTDAVKYVHGRYLFLADQDDLWQMNKISRQVDYLEKNQDCIMCICDRSVINAGGDVMCPSLFEYRNADLGKRDYRKVINSVAQYPANCMCLRTGHLRNIFPIPAKIGSHDTFITIMAAHYGKIGYVKNVLTKYRIHGKNLSGQYAIETNKNVFKAWMILYKSFRRKKKIEKNDTLIIQYELQKRFHECRGKSLKKIWGYEIKNTFMDTVKYMLRNLEKRGRFCK